jgi:hypothetical protein
MEGINLLHYIKSLTQGRATLKPDEAIKPLASHSPN